VVPLRLTERLNQIHKMNEMQPLLNERVKTEPKRRSMLVGMVVAVAVLGTGLVIADKAGYFGSTAANTSFRASDGLTSADPTKKPDMGGIAQTNMAPPVAPGMEVKQGLAPVLAGAPSAGTSKQVPASATGAAVAKQAGVAKTTGPVLPPSVDVNSDAAAAAATKATGPVLPPSVDVNSATMKASKKAAKAAKSSSTPAIADTEVKTLVVKGISEHDSHTPEGAKAIQEIKKAKDTVKAAANGKTLEEAKKVVQLEKKEAKVSGSSRPRFVCVFGVVGADSPPSRSWTDGEEGGQGGVAVGGGQGHA